MTGTLTREGFCSTASEGHAPSKSSTLLVDLFVTGECLRGQNVHQNTYPQTELGKVRTSERENKNESYESYKHKEIEREFFRKRDSMSA